MSKVSEKNTKKEILEYVKELELKISNKAEARKTTADVQKETEVKKIKEDAKELIDTGIVNEATVEKYNNLKKTIELLDAELEDVYGIQRGVHTLEALIIANSDKMTELNDKYVAKKTELEEEFNSKKEFWDNKLVQAQKDHDKLVKDLRDFYSEEKSKLDKERAREKEEYAYDLKRERSIEDDKWEDEKATREKELAKKELAVTEREKIATDAIAEKITLEDKVKELEAMIVKEKEESFEAGKAKAKKDADTAKVFSDRAHKSELERKDDLIASLQSNTGDLKSTNQTLQNKLDEAYTRIQEMAIEAAKNSGTRVIETSK